MTVDELKKEITSLLSARELTQIESDPELCLSHIERAFQHLNSANTLTNSDSAAAIQLAYDAARKSLNAVLMVVGLKVHERAGSHGSFVRLSKLSYLDQEIWAGLELLKKLRNQAEYGDRPSEFSQSFTASVIREAHLMVSDAEALVLRLSRNAPGSRLEARD